MGRWIVIFGASILFMGILLAFFPGLRTASFNVGEHAVHWAIVLGLGMVFACHKLTGK
jgi:hypothetical protein